MSIIIDLIVVGIIVLIAFISAKQGFVRVAVEVVGCVAAIIIAIALSLNLANITYDKVIEPPIVESILSIADDNFTQNVDSTWQALPEFIKDNAEKFGVSKDTLLQGVTLSTQESTKTTIQEISKKSLKPIAVNILKLVYTIIITLVLMVVVKILARLINKLFSFSLVGKVNTILGGLFGTVKGVIFACIFCTLVVVIISFVPDGIWIFNNENIDKTVVFKILADLIHI